MVWWWWIAPAVAGLIGTGLLVRGLLALFKGRVFSGLLVGAGGAVFFGVAFAVGALDKDLLGQLRRRRPARTKADDEILEVE